LTSAAICSAVRVYRGRGSMVCGEFMAFMADLFRVSVCPHVRRIT
jgi:hypothetical protein